MNRRLGVFLLAWSIAACSGNSESKTNTNNNNNNNNNNNPPPSHGAFVGMFWEYDSESSSNRMYTLFEDGTIVEMQGPDGGAADIFQFGASASPNGQRLFYGSYMGATDGSMTPVQTYAGSAYSFGPFVWRDDSTGLVFGAGSDLVYVNADGTGATTLTDSYHSSAERPELSPDGQHVIFQDSSDVWHVARLSDGTATEITDARDATWLAADRLVYFKVDGGTYTIYTNSPAFDDEQTLLVAPGAIYDGLAVSPDGSMVAWNGRNIDDDRGILAVSTDGTASDATDVSADFGTVNASVGEPIWMPDGAHLLYFSGQYLHTLEAYLAAADGSSVLALAPGMRAYQPVVEMSPDGTKLFFTAVEEEGNEDVNRLFVAPTDASAAATVVSVPFVGDVLHRGTGATSHPNMFPRRTPRWSTDSACIMYVYAPQGATDTYYTAGTNQAEDLHVVAADGSGGCDSGDALTSLPAHLANGTGRIVPMALTATKVVFADGNGDIYVLPRDTSAIPDTPTPVAEGVWAAENSFTGR